MTDRFSWDLLHCDRTKSDSTHPPNLTEGLRATRQSRPCTSFPRCHHLNWKWWNDLAKPHLESQTKANLQDHYPKYSTNAEQTWFMLQAAGAEIKCENVTGLTSFPSRDTGRVCFLSLSLQILFNTRFWSLGGNVFTGGWFRFYWTRCWELRWWIWILTIGP